MAAASETTVSEETLALARLCDEARSIDGVDTGACARLAQKIAAHAFHLVVAGQRGGESQAAARLAALSEARARIADLAARAAGPAEIQAGGR